MRGRLAPGAATEIFGATGMNVLTSTEIPLTGKNCMMRLPAGSYLNASSKEKGGYVMRVARRLQRSGLSRKVSTVERALLPKKLLLEREAPDAKLFAGGDGAEKRDEPKYRATN